MKLSQTTMFVAGLLLLAVASDAHRGPTRYRFKPASHQSYSFSHYGQLAGYNCGTKVTTTAAPAPAPPVPSATDLQNLITLLTQLSQLALPLFLNLLSNVVPPTTPEVIVPPRLMRRQVLIATPPPCSPLPSKYADWVKGFNSGALRAGATNTVLYTSELEALETCQLVELGKRLNVSGVARAMDLVELFLLNPNTTELAERRTIASTLAAVSKGGKATGLVPLASQKLHKRQDFYDPTYMAWLKQYYPVLYNYLYPATTPPPPPPSVDVLGVLTAVLRDMGPSLNLGLSAETAVAQINRTLPLLTNLLDKYTAFVRGVKVADRLTSCQQLLAKYRNPSLPYGVRNTAAYIYNIIRCLNTTAATTATVTTVKPSTTACGQSPTLSKTLAVENSTLFVLSRIVGGTSTLSCQKIPWQVRLVMDGTAVCGGSILDSTHILTAAHCIGAGIRNIQVTAGEYDTSVTEGTEQIVNVPVTLGSNVLVYPGYYTTAAGEEVGDLAIIKLPTPLNLNNPCIKTVCLDPNFSLTGGKNCTVSGWGVTQSATSSLPATLQMATVQTFDGPYCQSAFGTASGYVAAPQTMLCAGFRQGGVDSCQGDSGGPLVCSNPATNSFVQVGIVSHGEGCALASRPGIYTSVADFYAWVKANSSI